MRREIFEQWLSSTRGTGATLDTAAYASLVKPSEAVAPFTYSAIEAGLFARILSPGLQTEDGRSSSYPVCVRGDR
jgi:cytochrome o ubiquinol oxidase subunit II